MHETFTKIDHTLGHQVNLSKLNNILCEGAVTNLLQSCEASEDGNGEQSLQC